MKHVSVRCWRVQNYRPGKATPDELWITYPEGSAGHDLITCLRCGTVFAVTLALAEYVGPDLKTKLKETLCSGCGSPLDGHWAAYPETYIAEGKEYRFERDRMLPPDDESIVREFEGIYES